MAGGRAPSTQNHPRTRQQSQPVPAPPRGRPGPATHVGDEDGEFIDVRNVTLSSDESGGGVPPPRARTQVRARRARRAPAIDDPDPLLDTTARKEPSTTDEITYFFDRNETETVCKNCKAIRDQDVAAWNAAYGPNTRVKRTVIYSEKTGITNLRGHIFRWHLLEYLTLAIDRSWIIGVNPVKSAIDAGYPIEELKTLVENGIDLASLTPRLTGNAPDLTGRKSIPEFSLPTFHQFLVSFIVSDDQSLNVIEQDAFRNLLLLLREGLRDRDIPRRTKLRELVIAAWQDSFGKLKQEMQRTLGDISFTADIWSDAARRPYLAMTAHWIAPTENTNRLELKVALVAFHRIQGHHTGKSLARTVLYLLDRAGITSKIGHFTLDNAENNATMLEELQHLLRERGITFDARDRRIRCFPHIINICVQHILDAFSAAGPSDLAKAFVHAFPDGGVDSEEYLKALGRNPIARGRQIVKAVRSSCLRRERFMELTKSGLFEVPEYQLLRDVRTRWDSVYYMINRLRVMRPVVDVFLTSRDQYDIAEYKLSNVEWLILEDYEAVLEISHGVQQSMSSESRPRLGSAISHFEMFMTIWENAAKKFPRCQPFIDIGLEWAKRYYNRMDDTRAYVIAMFIEPSIRMNWIRAQWGESWINDAEKKIIELMEYYRKTKLPQNLNSEEYIKPSNGLDSINALASRYGIKDLGLRRPLNALRSVRDEYNSYVSGDLHENGLDPLGYWEMKKTEYPTIFRIAMDYLPIQASAVPCERVFSSSAETDTKRRNRISPVLMEALQMLKFYLKKERLNFTRGWITSQKILVEDEPDEPGAHNTSTQQDNQLEDTLSHILTMIAEEEGDGIADEITVELLPL